MRLYRSVFLLVGVKFTSCASPFDITPYSEMGCQAQEGPRMDSRDFTVESHPAVEDVRFLEDRLYDYNAAQTGVDDGQWLAIFVRDEQQQICAGLGGRGVVGRRGHRRQGNE